MKEKGMGLDQEQEINVLDLLVTVLKHKKLIFRATFGTAIVTALISLIMRPVYMAKTELLPPAQQTRNALSSLLHSSLLSVIGGATLNITRNGALYVELLKSRPILDRVADQLNLVSHYGVKTRYAARKSLLHALIVREDIKSGIITIEVKDKDPKKAAFIANAFVQALQDMNNRLAITAASQKSLFYKEQLSEAKAALLKAEGAMMAFQQKTGLVEAKTQGKAIIQAIAGLRAQIVATEVQIRVMKTYSTLANPGLQTAEEQLAGLRAEESKLEAGGGNYSSGPLIPTSKIPAIQADYENKLMTLKFDEKFYELLQSQYESAKIDEAGDPSIIQVIDKAVPPVIWVSPKRARMVILSAFVAFLFSIYASFFIERHEKLLSDPRNKHRLEAIKKYAGHQFAWPPNLRLWFKRSHKE